MKRAKETKFRPLMEIERLHIGLVWVWLILSITGCTQVDVEENDIPFHALKDVEAGFNLHVLDSQTTRSATGDTLQTRAEKALDNTQESKISTIWIGQYDAATGNRMFSQYLESVDDEKAVNVKLKQSNDRSAKSHIWFVANSGNPEAAGEIAKEESLKEHVLTYSFTDDGLPESQLCGMAGMWEGIVKEGAMKDLTVNLTRLVAKITFTYAIGGSDFTFTPSSVTLNSVPDKSQIAAPEKQLTSVTYKRYSGPADNSVTTMCWYLPENMAGTATGDNAVNSVKKKTGKGVSNATYIELIGEAVQGGVTYQNVTFRFYPGKDQNNYDIIRNSHYTVNVTLVGIDVSDERITVGKVPPVEFDAEKMLAEKGGEKKVQVTVRPGQEWSFDMPQWLSALIEGKTVSGGATVTYQGPYQLTFQAADANPRAEDRSVEFPVHINGEDQKVIITQSGSDLSITEAISLAATAEATGSSSFTATKGLLWDATLNEGWLSWAADNPSTSGNAEGSSQILKVRSNSPNPLAAARSGKITVKAGASIIEADYDGLRKEIEVTQAASTVTGSTKTVSAEALNGLTSSFTATPGLNWAASLTDGSWITFTSSTEGTTTVSPQSLTYNVAINPNAESRTENITVRAGDETSGPTGAITVTQEGSVFDVTGPTEKIPADGTKTVTGSVSATAGLAWAISPEESNSIKVSPIAGSGYSELTFTGEDNDGRELTGSFTVTVTANPARIASISVKQESKEVPAILGSIEVDKIQYRETMEYGDANRYCQSKGWRIPTATELYNMYQSRYSLMAIDGFDPFITTTNTLDRYWSCTFNAEGIIVRYFGKKVSTAIPSHHPSLVRCVRDIVN